MTPTQKFVLPMLLYFVPVLLLTLIMCDSFWKVACKQTKECRNCDKNAGRDELKMNGQSGNMRPLVLINLC